MNINEKIEIILNNIKNKHYTSFEFVHNKKRKLEEIENDLYNNLEISFIDNKFYIMDKKIRKNIVCNDCPICYEKIKITDKVTLQCRHIFCTHCHYNWEKTCFLGKKDLSCPLCRRVYDINPI